MVIYSLYYLLLRDTSYFFSFPRKLRHVYKLVGVVWVYGFGSWALQKICPVWMNQLWHIIHILLLSFLIVVGVIDWSIGSVSFSWKHLAATIHEILISPVLYVSMVIVSERFKP
jgi:hypothetical protein